MTAPLDPKPATGALALETVELTKRFGSFTAMDAVSMTVAPVRCMRCSARTAPARARCVKCVAGSQRPEGGAIMIDGREHDIATPVIARALGIGMVYQHFTLAPGMNVAENLLLAGGRTPALIDWKKERAALQAFLRNDAVQARPRRDARRPGAGEKQKLELLKQLYLKPRLLILDEPTSVLTPQEADEVLAYVRAVAQRGECTVLMITHKFREVMAYADEVTVLRRGKRVHGAKVAETTPEQLAQAMIGDSAASASAIVAEGSAAPRAATDATRRSRCRSTASARWATAARSRCRPEPAVRSGEILGIAGVSGNGQRELVEALVGQRRALAGTVRVVGEPYMARAQREPRAAVARAAEEPLRNACVGELSVAQNMALRDFDEAPLQARRLAALRRWRERARAWIAEYGVKTRGENAPIASLSGGNVQRAVLARELAGSINVLIAANPVFGSDFAAVAEIHARILQVRAKGGAVLLISEDLDELLELSDRIAVMSEGRIVFETPPPARIGA
jgi:simple sugar transport system ATP-binding protein